MQSYLQSEMFLSNSVDMMKNLRQHLWGGYIEKTIGHFFKIGLRKLIFFNAKNQHIVGLCFLQNQMY